MDNNIPDYVEEVLRRLHAAGWQACPVGGCVRDTLLGKKPQDWDIAAASEPQQTEQAVADLPCLETGIRHGTVTVLSGGRPVEVTTFRIDGSYSDNRRPDRVTFTRSLPEDLRRRDFTVNAMAWDDGKLIDLFGGRADLAAKQIRCVGEPEVRFAEDGLRILRALRFASVLDFQIESETAAAVHRQRSLLQNIAAERVGAELAKLLCGAGAARILADFRDVIFTVIPELAAEESCSQHSPYHHFDVWGHTVSAVAAAPPQLLPRLTMLLHDIGKPLCRTTDESGTDHFYRHAEVGAPLARRVLRRLRFSTALCQTVEAGVQRHMLFLEPDEHVLSRRLRQFGPEFCFFLLNLQRADTKAQSAAVQSRLPVLDRSEQMLHSLLQRQACFSRKQLAVRGGDLTALGLHGPAVGKALESLLDAVIDGRCPNEKAALLAYWKQQCSKT
ncbi:MULTISPECIES: CCA tRNA nucleotidyltransferase [Caproicibacterium]|uniref:HD domain-containing protein n=1 Tax=Caproicibacterium argilliputei TaxID=3030016 RepID=A0AA97D8E7_9FIRM|nr:HD domain-containing protein [Caproicibacterium argilliputei]WOC31572.1 HD domain-containing protein [Caproicibacterium argilliputei]